MTRVMKTSGFSKLHYNQALLKQ